MNHTAAVACRARSAAVVASLSVWFGEQQLVGNERIRRGDVGAQLRLPLALALPLPLPLPLSTLERHDFVIGGTAQRLAHAVRIISGRESIRYVGRASTCATIAFA